MKAAYSGEKISYHSFLFEANRLAGWPQIYPL